MSKLRQKRYAGLDVTLVGGADGQGGGEGPLCVLLHGFGAPGRDLVIVGEMLAPTLAAPARREQAMRFAFPAAPLTLAQLGLLGLGEGRAWWMVDIESIQRRVSSSDFSAVTRSEPEGLGEAREHVVAALADMQKDLGVPNDKLVLGGFSQGAMLSLDVALRTALPLRGLVLWSTTLIAEPVWQPLLAARSGLRVLQSHGRQDAILPFAIATVLRDKLLAAGLQVQWLEFDGGHEIRPAVMQATTRFLDAT